MNFIVNDFLNTISVNDTHSIYINILNKVTFQSYETTFIKKDIPNLMDIPSFYKLMIKCFQDNNSSENNYSVKYEVSDGKIGVTFNVNIDNIFTIVHTLYIKESIMNSDKLVTTKINSMKEMYETEIKELKKSLKEAIVQINNINNEPILITTNPSYVYLPKSITKLDLSAYNNNDICWLNYSRFNNISELKINTSYIANHKGSGAYTSTIWPFSVNFIFTIINQGPCLQGSKYFDIFNFPTVKHLIITYKSDTPQHVELGALQNIPNIEKLTLENFSHKITILSYIKCLTKLKDLVFIDTDANQMSELREYCITNKIKIN